MNIGKWLFRLSELIDVISRCPRKRELWNHRGFDEAPHDWAIFAGVPDLIRQWREKDQLTK